MRKSKTYLITTAILLVFFVQMAGAYNLRFLNFSPVRHFTEQDWQLATAAVRQALNETQDGETVSWDNPQSKSFGTITPVMTESQNGGNRSRGIDHAFFSGK
jgi:surface antigen